MKMHAEPDAPPLQKEGWGAAANQPVQSDQEE